MKNKKRAKLSPEELNKVMPVRFIPMHNNDDYIRFISYGTVMDFTSDHDKSIKLKSRQFITDGLNHLLGWAYLNGKETFLRRFSLFVYQLKTNVLSQSFDERFHNELKKSKGKKEQDFIKGELYSEEFIRIDNVILYTIIEYVQQNTIYNSETEIDSKGKPLEGIPALKNMDIFILSIIITVSKLVTLGAILLGKKGKIHAYVIPSIIKCLNIISDGVLSSYLYDTGQMDYYNQLLNLDLHDNIYIYLRDIIDDMLTKNAPTTELVELNGKNRQSLLQEIIDYSLSTVYKIIPIEYANENAAVNFRTGYEIDEFKFTSRNIMKYLKQIIKKNHEYKNTKAKHPNVVKAKRIMQDVGQGGGIWIHRQELRVEKKDTRSLERRKDHVSILTKYVDNYITKYNVPILPTTKTKLSDFFIVKLLDEITEDYITLKLIDPTVYQLTQLMISHMIFKKYPTLAMALKATSVLKLDLPEGTLDKYIPQFKKIPLYSINKDKFMKEFERIVSYEYIFKNDEGGELSNRFMKMDIKEEFIKFLLDDRDDPFIFFGKDYFYDECR